MASRLSRAYPTSGGNVVDEAVPVGVPAGSDASDHLFVERFRWRVGHGELGLRAQVLERVGHDRRLDHAGAVLEDCAGDDALGRRDFAEDAVLGILGAVGGGHDVAPGAAHAQVEFVDKVFKPPRPHHLATCAESVQACQTRSRGAQNTRSITVSLLLSCVM